MKYYRTDLVGDGQIHVSTGNTNIGEPVSSCSFSSVCYVVDGGRTLYEVDYHTTLSKKKIDDDVISVQLSANGSQVEYTKKDGTVVAIENTGAASGYADRAKKYLGIDSGTFYIQREFDREKISQIGIKSPLAYQKRNRQKVF